MSKLKLSKEKWIDLIKFAPQTFIDSINTKFTGKKEAEKY